MRPKLTFANVMSSAALFVALGGTAAAAVTLPRDSVGSVQISQDGVRSPEISSGAVRSSEILDEGVRFADIAPAARPELLGELHVAEDDTLFTAVPECNGTDVSVCPDRLSLALTPNPLSSAGEGSSPGPAVRDAGRNWLVQARLKVRNTKGRSFTGNRCGIVNTARTGPAAVLDEVQLSAGDEALSLSAAVRKGAGNPTIAVRCTSQNILNEPDTVALSSAKMHGLEVGAVTGP